MYRFALRPRWIVSHVIVATLVIVMVNLGFWQLRRLEERQARNDVLRAAISAAPKPYAELRRVNGDLQPDQMAKITGRYLPGQELLIRGRSLDDSPGSWVVAPLQSNDGVVVAVNRGWIRNDGSLDAVPTEYAKTPSGSVTVVGLLHGSQTRGPLGATDPKGGQRVTSLARLDTERIAEQVPGDVSPLWLQLTEPEPNAPEQSPKLLGLPEVNDNGSHLSYAGQWFVFAAIAGFGYPMILRRRASEPHEISETPIES